ncbi:extracellular solute-binding protein [Microbacterium esteraromaticum]|uniref:extracellular solute-binding protein n=1 Tax=Microbacterium esteraromaticum TaxID=57043 RepID=UPI001C947D6B|nr:extracellular solute-binding protein [Microbacterium esteraromaticum]MBY6062215.1 extracellular solute-binding protein [Microbacterium esteraromaticum]
MNRKLKSLTVVGATSVIALVASGCSAGTDSGPATAECPDGVVTLSVLRAENSSPTDAQLEAVQATSTCVEFDVSEVPFGQLAEKIAVTASSSNAPDIIGYDSPDTQSYASQGLLLPLDTYLPEGWYEDVAEATLAENSWEGNVYSPGMQQDALALYYNKDMTDSAGIEVPSTLEDAWTWPEALEAFKTCQQGAGEDITVFGLAPSRLGNGTPGFAYRDLLFARSAGDPDADEDSSAYKTYWALAPDGSSTDGWLNTPEAIEADLWYQALFNGPEAVTSKTGLPNALIDGKACFDIEVGSMIGTLTKADPDFEWAVSPLPYFETPIVHTGAVTVGVSARTAHPDVAAEAVVAMSTGDLLTEFSRENLRVPVLKSSVAEIDFLNEYPYTILVGEIQEWGQPRPPSPSFTQYNQYVTEALRDIAYGSDVEDSLNKAVEQIDPLLNR